MIWSTRTKDDWVVYVYQLLKIHYHDALTVQFVVDNLNIHDPADFYKYFGPETAKQFLNRLEFYYKPKQANWLNIVEIKLSVLNCQYLAR